MMYKNVHMHVHNVQTHVCMYVGSTPLYMLVYEYMNNHIYSTLLKTQERESDRRRKETEQRKESQKTHTNKTTRTCDPKY